MLRSLFRTEPSSQTVPKSAILVGGPTKCLFTDKGVRMFTSGLSQLVIHSLAQSVFPHQSDQILLLNTYHMSASASCRFDGKQATAASVCFQGRTIFFYPKFTEAELGLQGQTHLPWCPAYTEASWISPNFLQHRSSISVCLENLYHKGLVCHKSFFTKCTSWFMICWKDCISLCTVSSLWNTKCNRFNISTFLLSLLSVRSRELSCSL